LNLLTFRGTNHNTTHSNTQPPSTLGALINIHGEAMWQQQGKKDLGTSLIAVLCANSPDSAASLQGQP
jgi:hypothetical protein